VAHQGAAGEHQIGARHEKRLIHQKILLFPPQVGLDTLHLLVKIAGHRCGGLIDGPDGTQQGRLVVEGFPRITDEYGGNAQGRLTDKRRRRGIPGRIPPGLKGSPDAAARKGGGIGFLLRQHLAAESLNHPAIPVVFNKGIVLLGRTIGQGMKPMGVMGRPVLERPRLHPLGHLVSHLPVNRRAPLYGRHHRLVSLPAQILLHLRLIKDQRLVIFRCQLLPVDQRPGLPVHHLLQCLESHLCHVTLNLMVFGYDKNTSFHMSYRF